MFQKLKYISTAIFIAFTTIATAQNEEEDKLNGGSITVVKAYDPSIADAFKVKSIPQLNDTTRLERKSVTYSIFSVPVASTFTPAKGKLSRLKPRQRPKYYDNYARLGIGNYGNIIAEFAGNLEVDKDSDVGIFLNHNSSLGGIDEVALDDSYLDTALDLSYGHRSRNSSYGITAGLRYQDANLYGVNELLFNQLDEISRNDTDVSVNYLSYGIGGNLEFFDGVVKNLEARFSGITGNKDAQEVRAMLLPTVGFNIEGTEVELGIIADFLSGSFEKQGRIIAPENYSYLSTGVNPSINIYGDAYKIELGATINYLTDLENDNGQFNVYPDVNATYRLINESIIAFAQITGGLDINSLQQITDENVFVAPSLIIKPTDRSLDTQIGLKGKVTEIVGYKIYGGYKKENDRFFYTKDTGRIIAAQAPADELGNVFYTQYADLTTTFYGASLSVDVNSRLNLTLGGKGFNYEVTNGEQFENTPSQLPQFTADVVGTYKVNDKIDIGTTVYFVGEREVYRIGTNGTTTLDGFVDLNVDVNYRINSRLTAFLRGNNLTGGNYEYFLDYPVQNLQVMGGAVYKFDF